MANVDDILEVVREYLPMNELHPYDQNELVRKLDDLIAEIVDDAEQVGFQDGYSDGQENGDYYGYERGFEEGLEKGYDECRSDVLTAVGA